MTARIFIDGAVGTTGLEIRERLAARADLKLVALAEPIPEEEMLPREEKPEEKKLQDLLG
jgi:N-acetyl-gamma-glutamylphosphate reductase